MENKKIFVLCLHSKGYMSYGHLFTMPSNNVHPRHLLVGMPFSSYKDETLTLHSFVTIDYRDVIKWNSRNV